MGHTLKKGYKAGDAVRFKKRYAALAAGWLLLLSFAVLLFSFPEESAAAARQGIKLCLDLLVPSLFPFFVLSSLLISTGLAGLCARPLGRVMSPLFGVSGSGAAALILGAVGGYPVGARTLAQLVERRECSQAEARRLSLFCNNCGPAFFIGAAGAGVFGSKEAGFLMLGANLSAAVLLGVFLRLFGGRVNQDGTGRQETVSLSPLSVELPECVRSAFTSTLNVCAYVILFSILTALAERSGALPFLVETLSAPLPLEHGETLCRSFLVGLLELSTGSAALENAAASPGTLPLAAFILGWGGLSVHCQSLPFWRKAGVPAGPYLRSKLAQGLLSALLTYIGVKLFPLTLPVMAPAGILSAAPQLLGKEILALWALSGVYFLLSRKKRLEKQRKSRYTRHK